MLGNLVGSKVSSKVTMNLNQRHDLVAAALLAFMVTCACLWMLPAPTNFFHFQQPPNADIQRHMYRHEMGCLYDHFLQEMKNICKSLEEHAFKQYMHFRKDQTEAVPEDKLERALEGATMENRTLIISVLNKAYVEQNGMLELFLRSFREGEDTEFLIKHLLLVAVDQTAFNRCKLLGLHCYQLVTEGVNFTGEVLYMSDDFIKMMWRRTVFLGDVLRRGYNFIFTDMDVMWLRNPFNKLSYDGEDMQISCDVYNGQPFDYSNPINTGFYYVASNNKTTALFDAWYGARIGSAGMKEQDVLSQMMYNGVFRQLDMKVRFLDTLHFSGFCQDSRDFREVSTVHANCCRSMKAKFADLTAVLQAWRRFNGTSTATWPAHEACYNAWRVNITV